MKSKWIKCARRKKEMRANKSWLKFTADYKVYKMAAAASVRQQPLLELCECKSVYFCAWVCVHWPRVICLCRCRLRAHCWFFIKIINAAAFGRMQKCGLLNYFRKSQRATSCAGQIENAKVCDDWRQKPPSMAHRKNLRRHNVALSQCAQRICSTFSKCFWSFLYLSLSLSFCIWQKFLKASEWTLKKAV